MNENNIPEKTALPGGKTDKFTQKKTVKIGLMRFLRAFLSPQNLFNDLVSQTFRWSPMYSEQFFEVCKAAIKRIGGIRNVQFRIFLVGEQIRKIQSQAPVGGTKSLVGIMPFSRYGVCCSFFEKGWPCCVPGIKSRGKSNFIRLAENCNEPFQFNACLKFRTVGQITCDDLFLMKVTHLDGYVIEYLPYPWPFIENYCLDGVSLSL